MVSILREYVIKISLGISLKVKKKKYCMQIIDIDIHLIILHEDSSGISNTCKPKHYSVPKCYLLNVQFSSLWKRQIFHMLLLL